MSRPYVPLHVHSQYTLLDGILRIGDYAKWAAANGCPAAALTDHGVLYGAVEFYNTAKYAGVRPIIGCEMYLVDGSITDRSSRQPTYHLVLLAKNQTGYENLCRLVSRSHLEGFYYKPRINWELLAANSEGLIALTACLSGPLAHAILRGNPEEARDRAKRLKAIFGEDLFLELTDHGIESEHRVNAETVRIAQEFDLPLVITNDSHFKQPEDVPTHDIVLCLRDGKSLSDPNRTRPYNAEYGLKTAEQLLQGFQNLDRAIVEQALDNTLVVAERCQLELQQGKSILPNYPMEAGQTPEGYLRQVVNECAQTRFDEITPEITERLDFELNIINQMGFPAYFLIVWDFIHYARQNNIPVGPGRGSAAGSLVAYTLGITNINPVEHNLLFERFLNPERVSMPDIDIDFCIDRREKVIEYVAQRYGRDHVCQIATFGTLAARAALKAVGRVLDIPFADSDRLAKLIPATPGTKLSDALADGQPLQKLYETDPKVKEIVDLALSIEGTAHSVGMHAAGVVISKDPLSQIVPLQLSKDGQVVSQYPMGDLEKLGLLKMDFLGLRNLTIIDQTLNLVEAETGIRLDMDRLPLDDQPVYAMLSAAQTDGVFQLESGGMKALVRDLKPTTFEDINALVALFRPGPLNSGMVKSFVDRKHGRAAVEYAHPDLEPILKDTYGTIVYQEQIMQIAQVLAGYSLGQADLLRRAMGKKKADVMAKEKDGFVQGAVGRGVDQALAESLFDTMSEFAAYCFNRSHSAAYALVAYQTAYLKAHHPVAYLSALLSSVRNDLDKTRHYLQTGRRMGIDILPPDVTTSGRDFTPVGGAIRFGLASIKNVGLGVVDSILEARAEKPFASLEDFLQRVNPKVLNRKTLESLVSAGALSEFGHSRKQLMANIEELVRYASRAQADADRGQVSLFGLLGGDVGGGFGTLMLAGSSEEYQPGEIQQFEKSLLGFYVSSHPLDGFHETLPLVVSHGIEELKELSDETEVRIGGLLTSVQRKTTKTGRPICIAQLEDFAGQVEMVAFSDTLERLGESEVLTEGRTVLISGKVQFRGDDNDSMSVIMQDAQGLEAVQPVALKFAAVPRYEDLDLLRRVLAEERQKVAAVVRSQRGEKAKPPLGRPVILCFPDGTRVKTGIQFWMTEGADVQRLVNGFGDFLAAS